MVVHRDREHEFALYVYTLSQAVADQADLLRIQDVALMHRIIHVLRLEKEDTLVLFDENIHVRASILSIEKKAIICAMQVAEQNIVVAPHITVWLPLLKREAFEEAIYALVELGVNEIQLVHTAKEQRHWTGQKEMQRIHNIMVAAAEQSKNFAMAAVREPRTLSDVIASKKDAQGIFFDVEGEALLEVASGMKHSNNARYIITVGPEGDLLDAEKFQLQKALFAFVRLTPTVLRAQQALAVGVGAVRSLL
jgi:RsmE family RNA methyltransferase